MVLHWLIQARSVLISFGEYWISVNSPEVMWTVDSEVFNAVMMRPFLSNFYLKDK